MTKDTTYPAPHKVIEREVIIALSKVLDQEEESQLYAYGDSSRSDAVIATEMTAKFMSLGVEITSSRVQGIRQRFFGKFPPKLTTEERLARAEAELVAAKEEIAKLKNKLPEESTKIDSWALPDTMTAGT